MAYRCHHIPIIMKNNKAHKKLTVKSLINKKPYSFEHLDILMAYEDLHRINHIPWKQYPYLPEVKFKIGYTDASILLKAFVKEKFIKAKYDQINDPVYKDSSFEFFISLDNDDSYYNFEFNCIGTPYLAYGNRKNREVAPLEVVELIHSHSSLGSQAFEEKQGAFSWELAISIPFSSFFKHEIRSMQGKVCKANFYKCGDELSQKHFVSWSPIENENPDFHRPEYFGELYFVEP